MYTNVKVTGIERRFGKKLMDMGLYPNICGYDYLLTAFMMVFMDRSILHKLTKFLYPEIAKEYNTTPSRVERGIRHAIETINVDKTNGQFIAQIVEEVRLEEIK